MTDPDAPQLTRTSMDEDGNLSTEEVAITDLPLATVLELVQHGDPRAADELNNRAVQYGLDNGLITQAELDAADTEEEEPS